MIQTHSTESLTAKIDERHWIVLCVCVCHFPFGHLLLSLHVNITPNVVDIMLKSKHKNMHVRLGFVLDVIRYQSHHRAHEY